MTTGIAKRFGGAYGLGIITWGRVFIISSLASLMPPSKRPEYAAAMAAKNETAMQKPADLKGKVIGIGTADGAEASFARSIFGDLGMEEGKDYTFLVVGDGGLATAGFMRGDIDAYVAATSDAAILNSRGLALRNITPEKFRQFFGNGGHEQLYRCQSGGD